ncbi:MAG: hypothetical protein MHM6MM_003809 [Cercozoa sp. M6MM]
MDAVVPSFYFVWCWPDRYNRSSTCGSDIDDDSVIQWFSRSHQADQLQDKTKVRRGHRILHYLRKGNLAYLSKTLTLRRLMRRILEHTESATMRHFGNPRCPTFNPSDNETYWRQGMRISTWYACLHWLSGQDRQRVMSRMLEFAIPSTNDGETQSDVPTVVANEKKLLMLPMAAADELSELLQNDGLPLLRLEPQLFSDVFDANTFNPQNNEAFDVNSRQLIATHLRAVLHEVDAAVACVARESDQLVDKFDDAIRFCVRSAVLTLLRCCGAASQLVVPDDVLECVCEFVFPVKLGAKRALTARSSD